MKYTVTDGRDSFAVEELLPESKIAELKAKLLGYEVEKMETSNKKAVIPKLK